ncbi:glycosyltransferase [Mycoplasmopsis felifaucium]|uniref:glycosyltransferase n=1 Tax=Mycoplasmopsis felifaucium TaxID=35768 RepID=UPI00048932C0|nr:glycosyltransferase [Mycoplasmopsis felifaucium]
MQLSVIVPNIQNNKELAEVFDTFINQDNQDFELILVLSNANKSMFSTIEKTLKFFGSRLKFILNENRSNIQNDIITAFHLVKGKFTYVYSPDNNGRYYYVSRIVNEAQKYNADILEFRPRLVNSIRWKPEPRLVCDQVLDKNKKPEYVAYAYPFIFNKVFKSTLISQLVKYKQKETNDTKFAIQLTYMLLIMSQTYVYVNKRIVRETIKSNIWLVPNNFINQFNEILSYLKINNIKLTEEINYAKMYFLSVFLNGLLNTWRKRLNLSIFDDFSNYAVMRSKKSADDLHKFLIKEHSQNNSFFMTNIYMLKNNEETKLINLDPNINTSKSFLGEL